MERLAAAWDDAAAARLFAMNIELDEPIALRREALGKAREVHGALRPDPDLPEESQTPLQVTWWMAGERGGRVRFEIRLSPEASPLVQTFVVVSVPEPDAALAAVAASHPEGPQRTRRPGLPGTVSSAPTMDRGAMERIIRIAPHACPLGARAGRRG